MDQTIIDLYDRYTHGHLSRRGFMARLARLAGSTAAAAALLPLLHNDYASAAVVAADDPRIATSEASFAGPDGAIKGYLAQPSIGTKWPAVLVIHENRGLNPHIQDVARRVATEGFLAFAPDLLSTVGGTPADEREAAQMISALNPSETAARAASLVNLLGSHEKSTGAVGAVGFCWGGGMVEQLAMVSPSLKAGVAYYGVIPRDLSRAADIKAALMLHFAGLDNNVNARRPELEAALKSAGVTFESYLYEGVNHAFNNDTGAARYNKEAADLAWGRTISFLKRLLGAPA